MGRGPSFPAEPEEPLLAHFLLQTCCLPRSSAFFSSQSLVISSEIVGVVIGPLLYLFASFQDLFFYFYISIQEPETHLDPRGGSLAPFLCCFPRYTGWEVEQLGLELAPIWDVGDTGGGLSFHDKTLAHVLTCLDSSPLEGHRVIPLYFLSPSVLHTEPFHS